MATTSSTKTESSPWPGDNKTNSAPLYITIGPQCCGKTTLLKDIDGLQDVCLDDQMDVYVPITTQQWIDLLKTPTIKDGEDGGELKVSGELQQRVQEKTIAQRIQNDNPELNLILQRWNGDLSSSEFADALSQHYVNNVRSNNHNQGKRDDAAPNVAEVLIEVVEDFLSGSPELPATTEVFCLESLFKPHAKTNQSAIQVAHDLLKNTPSQIPLAWGNTNSKAKDFQQALDIAFSTKRPVHFLLCHPTWKLENEKHNIPWVDLSTLLSRNLQRLQASGRYIPANAIADCCQRIENQLIPSDCKSPWDVEQALVFQSTQPVRRHEKPLPFRYLFTRERLIQKEQRPPQRREHPRGPDQYSRGRRPQQQRPYERQNRRRDHDRQHQYPEHSQDDRRRNYDNRRRFDEDNRSRRWGQDDGRRPSGRGRGQDRGSRQPQERQMPPRGKRGYSDEDRTGGYPYGNDKRRMR